MISIISEINYILSSDENKSFNLDKWGNKYNCLFVVGLSGSGKTTFAKKYAIKNHANFIELDKYCKSFTDDVKHEYKKYDIDEEKINQIVLDKAFELIKSLEKKGQKCVIEGVEILFMNREYFHDKPIIILRTALLKSSLNAYKRNRKHSNNEITSYHIIKNIYDNQKEFIKRLKEFEEYMEEELNN